MALVQSVENGQIVSSTTSETTTASNNDLGYDEFLQLLCAEMQYQDPLEPTSNTEYVAQLATFSQMEAMLNMQNTIEASNANSLVGQYVIVKTTSSATGETTAIGGFVDYVQYENNKQYLSINGSLYSVDDVYEVADVEYMEAVALADAFAATVNNLPNVDKLTVAYQEDIENLTAVYDSLSSYQKSYISSDTLTKYNELVAAMKQLTTSTETVTETDGTTEDTAATEDTTTNTDDTTTTE